MNDAVLETTLTQWPVRRGKVRDVYDLGDNRLLIVATDRISAFDWVMPNGIPDKGRVLTGISDWWFDQVAVPHHRLATNLKSAGLDLPEESLGMLAGRSMVVRKTEVIPFECVVRGYISGSAWKEYRTQGTVCGQPLPKGLVESDRIDPIFTPATKAESGHDENIPFSKVVEALGAALAGRIKELSETIYRDAARYSLNGPGLILADTKFEFGIDPKSGELLLIDEILTPDSSRYWPANRYKPGGPQPSFDKQFVRDWLETTGWDKNSPPPGLPDDVVAKTREKYVDAYEKLTGKPFLLDSK